MEVDVLIVDDDAAVRNLVTYVLEEQGFSVREAADGVAALRELKERAPDVVVLDVMMPGLDGFGVLRAMRQQGLATKARVLLLTARVEERDYLRGWELGCDEYVTKPFSAERVGKIVRDLLRVTPESLQERREIELQKAELLDRLESAFSRPRLAPRTPRPARI